MAFSWVRLRGAEGCPAEPALAADVERRLGYDPFRPPFGQSLEGVVARAEGRWTVTLLNRDADGALLGRRELSSEQPACAALGDAVALAIALAIDPEAAMRAPTPATPDPSPAPGAADEAPADEAPDDPPAPPAAPPDRVRLSIAAVGSYDVVPSWGVGPRLAVDGPVVGPLRWYGAVVHWTEQVATLDDTTFGITLTTFSLGLCAGARFDWLRFDGCASIDVGGATAVVYSPTPRAPGERVFVGATGLVRLEARLVAPLWLGLFGGVAVPFVRHEYRVQGRPEVVFSPSALAPVAGAELAVRF
ncbi:MAG TPA: hypothetical protein RMH99_23475 [Sandaracinaceae bacterium LLY-WYZ-13_1]|nr:hypothetical protein [Sandaracinaceae bacterium LLY-WYZ-13_1]